MSTTLKVSLSHSIYFELQILISLLCLIWLMVNRAIQSSPQRFMALIKCTETASSSQPLPLLAGQGGREQSFNPAFHTDSCSLASFGQPVAAGVASSRCTQRCWRAVLAAAKQLSATTASAFPGTALSQQGFFSSQERSPFCDLDAVVLISPVTLEMVFKVCVSIPALWLS